MQWQFIKVGGCYSNGIFGQRWTVRQVAKITGEGEAALVSYKILVGDGRRRSHTCSLTEFAQWALNEVVRNENSWEQAPD